MSDKTTEKTEPKSLSEVVKDAFKELKETVIAFFKAPKAL